MDGQIDVTLDELETRLAKLRDELARLEDRGPINNLRTLGGGLAPESAPARSRKLGGVHDVRALRHQHRDEH